MLSLHYGCKVNQYETNGMIQQFKNAGYEIVDFEKYADIYVVNTCTVTSISDKKSRQMLRQAKRKNPNGIVIAVGCYVQVAKKEVDSIPEITFSVGTNEKNNLVELVNKYFENIEINCKISDVFEDKNYYDFGDVTYTEKTRAVIKVQDGCDRFCTYCLIPYARGRVRSRKPESIISEINKIAKEGIKEVIITGIHVASYGKDFNENYSLIDLLEEINQIEGIERIRLGSIEPLLISEEFIIRLQKLNKICHHFHLSLQSGAKATLERMNRRYTPEEFKIIVQRLRKIYDDVILTTDIIVGFPGETDEEFEETYKFLKEINFYKMHIFKYSQRKGTKAAVMENQVSGEKKEERSNRLLELSDNNELQYLNNLIGKEIDVLFEEEENGFYKGHTQNYIMVKAKSEKNVINKIEKVKLERVENIEIMGKVI